MAARLKDVSLPGTSALFGGEAPVEAPSHDAVSPAIHPSSPYAGIVPEPQRDVFARSAEHEKTISIKTLEGAGMASFGGHRDRVGEEFRIARQHVMQTMATADASVPHRNLVMVTSSRPGEGKSFAALNLAAALAEGSGRQVLLVDADMRDRSLSRLLGFADDPGLLDLDMSPSQTIRTAVIPSSLDNLAFLPLGGSGGSEATRAVAMPGNPVSALLEHVASYFRDSIVVVDVPACLADSDPAAFAPIVGQIVLVVEAGRTRRREVESALDLLDVCPHISLLLNKVSSYGSGLFGAYS
ncbi:MAG TPA: P-loop NTPase [Acetobacteraceae bacterium]|nr:P-loop NTPase [Acetobacteraceae bacterium]